MSTPTQAKTTETIEETTTLQGGATVTATAEASQEYIASNPRTPYSLVAQDQYDNYISTLPVPTDRVARDLGIDIYTIDMMLDPQVYSVASVLVMSILSDGYKVVQTDRFSDVPEAEEVREFCEDLLEETERPFIGTLNDLTMGMIQVGNKAGELVWEMRDYDGAQKIMLRDVKPRPHKFVRFVTDAYYNIIGLIYSGAGSLFMEGPIDARSKDYISRIIPRKKFLIPVFNPTNSDPRGHSHLASVYTPWWKKQQITPEHLAFIATFGSPSVYLELAPNTPAKIKITLLDGTEKEISSTAQGNQALDAFKARSSMTVPNGAKVHLVEIKGDGAALIAAFEHEDKQIAKGVLFQTMTTEETKSMARAASQTHKDVFGIALSYLRQPICFAVRHDIFTQAVRMNFPQRYWQYIPYLTLGGAQDEDLARLWTAAATLAPKYLTEAQKRDLDLMIGLPQRSAADVQKAQQLKDAAASTNRTLNPGGNTAGSGDGSSGGNYAIGKENNPNYDTAQKVGQNG